MTLQARLTELAQAIAADVKLLYANQGSLANLSTSAKTNLVSAINELQQAAAGGAGINDTSAATSTTTSYSANKITSLLASLKSDILGGAAASYDTLLELQNMLTADDNAIAGLLTAVGNRVRVDAAQSLTTAQALTARTNIGAMASADIGDIDHSFSTDYAAAKA